MGIRPALGDAKEMMGHHEFGLFYVEELGKGGEEEMVAYAVVSAQADFVISHQDIICGFTGQNCFLTSSSK